MAAAPVSKRSNTGIYWIHDKSDEDQPIVFVHEESRRGQLPVPFLKPRSINTESVLEMKSKKDSEIKAKTPVYRGNCKAQTVLSGGSGAKGKEFLQSRPADVLRTPLQTTQKPRSNAQPNQVVYGASQTKSRASLKDLCPEDKRRIANLIQELARANEEKEESVERLRFEQESFESKIQELEHQNLLILQEREGLQKQYRECQELLGLYQQYLSQQQEKLNHSIALLNQEQHHCKRSSSEGVPTGPSTSRPNGSALDGSYHSLPTATPKHPPEATSTPSSFSTPPPFHPSRESERSPATGPIKLPGCGKGGRIEHAPKSHQRRKQPVIGCRTDPLTHRDPEEQRSRLPRIESFAAPLLDGVDWEVKRQALLLQKRQLEGERQRLQARLAQQEERLLRQNQQLRQSRLDYSRFQQESAVELSRSISMERAAPNNAQVLDPPAHRTPLPRDKAHNLTDPDDQLEEDAAPQRESTPLQSYQNDLHVHEILNKSRKDMATSPLVSQAPFKKQSPVPAMSSSRSTSPQDRLDSSVVKLLDCFSPVSLPERCRTTLRTPRPAHSSRLPEPGPLPRSSLQQDLEESQILEDIFFIC